MTVYKEEEIQNLDEAAFFAHGLKAYPAVSSGVIAKQQVILSI